MPIYKNQPLKAAFQSLQLSGEPNTTTVPAVSVYHESVVQVAASPPQHRADGLWDIELTAAEMNADLVVLVATAPGCIPAQREFYTESVWTADRAANLDATISSRSTFAGGSVTVGGYAAGLDPATQVLRFPAQRLNTNSDGSVSVYLNGDKNGYGLKSTESGIVQASIAQAGSATTITLNGGDSRDGIYVGNRIEIFGGTGFGQSRVITNYTGSTQTATVDRPWIVPPDSTSSYAVKADSAARLSSSLGVVISGHEAGTDLTSALQSAGYTPTRAAKLDLLDTAISTRLGTASFVAPPSATAIAQAILVDPANRLATSPEGCVSLDLDQPIPTSNPLQSVGDALNAARAQGFGAWSLDLNARSLRMFAADGTTVVREFTLNSSTNPTTRV
ncbi:MAG: hypothetical protein SFX72_19680 [Isosphaeraceae bacterium]|nr:hypothetical protein [Isosphaeraceae bacterium]